MFLDFYECYVCSIFCLFLLKTKFSEKLPLLRNNFVDNFNLL